jgi:hypothetical protein
MDLKAYYRKIREIESGIAEEYPVVKSLATPNGGRPGHLTEVTRPVAARMLAEGLVEVASAEEARGYRKQIAIAQQAEEERREAAKIQFTILSEGDLRGLRRASRGSTKE